MCQVLNQLCSNGTPPPMHTGLGMFKVLQQVLEHGLGNQPLSTPVQCEELFNQALRCLQPLRIIGLRHPSRQLIERTIHQMGKPLSIQNVQLTLLNRELNRRWQQSKPILNPFQLAQRTTR